MPELPEFDDPFPLLPADRWNYAWEQAHAALVDGRLGLRTLETEREVRAGRAGLAGHQAWVDLPVQAMLTPYTELRAMLADLSPAAGQTVVDLGAGYGRLGFVISRHYEGVRFVGYELVAQRVAEGRRALRAAGADPHRIELLQADLGAADFAPIPADFYFIYDYGTREAIAKTLADLRGIARHRIVTVAGRGRAARDAIEHSEPWLSLVVPPVHRGRYSIYRSG